ncbi:PALD-like protein [Mya arenaria]|uniref:PALD-like protein n=1 Tax=Mya arenaria TaxID=6604 RepID=A0ABY7DJF2_MYAAR|nr:PALD-like protein [Mya arenaria]WAQ96828.1 PALD-like protein [Mya arenaria]
MFDLLPYIFSYKIVQKLVRMLPNGQQVKREVDFILDEIFNTMTPTMFHMREIIFVTYNKINLVTHCM